MWNNSTRIVHSRLTCCFCDMRVAWGGGGEGRRKGGGGRGGEGGGGKGGGIPMSHVNYKKNGTVALSNLRKLHVALSNLNKPHVAMSILRKCHVACR